MIFVLSNNNDNTTTEVLKWLHYFKRDFVRVNGEEEVGFPTVEIGPNLETIFRYRGKKINLEDIDSYWYRRGKINIGHQTSEGAIEETLLENYLHKIFKDEKKIVEDYFYRLLEQKKSIGRYYLRGINKLHALKTARKHGLEIPDTLITGKKEKLIAFLKKHTQLITKPIFEVPIGEINNMDLIAYTSLFGEEKLANLQDEFFPSLFQQYVAKKYELRIFYLDGQCHATAIFSQLDEKTSVDFRQYNLIHPNRRVPFKLPENITKKLIAFMREVQLNCGSIDMILTPENNFVFLEVNPIGQFGMTSHISNYHLEKKIAEFLIDA